MSINNKLDHSEFVHDMILFSVIKHTEFPSKLDSMRKQTILRHERDSTTSDDDQTHDRTG